MKRYKIISLLLALSLFMAGCGSSDVASNSATEEDTITEVVITEAEISEVEITEESLEAVDLTPTEEPVIMPEAEDPEESEAEESAIQEDEVIDETPEESLEELPLEEELEAMIEEPITASSTQPADPNGILVVIDAGHQAVGNSSQEPVGPGATETKAKVSSGTTGRFTGIPEYVLTLEVSLMLEEELLARGYDVIMVRSTHDVDISNAERAQVANDAGADVFIRIHANGSDDASVQGAFTICSTPNNPYCSEVYSASRLLSECVLDGFIATTGAKERSIWETDTMTGINWCTVPSTIIEMGFMTNQEEDEKMATEEYRALMVQGMADGIDLYIASQ